MGGLGVLALLYLLAASSMAPLELRADPTDPDYAPRPERYFLWLFQFGKYVELVPWVESLVVPMAGLAIHQDRDLAPKLPYEQAMEVRANDIYKDLWLECHGAEGRGHGTRSLSFNHEETVAALTFMKTNFAPTDTSQSND